MPITSLILALGGEIFVDFEVPQQIRQIGGHQAIAQHDFPGGIRTQRTFGAFPAAIEWSGLFTGTGALARMRQVDRLRVAGQEVALVYGGTTLLGVVSDFSGEPRHQWLVPYRIRFATRADLSCMTPLDSLFSMLSIVQSAMSTLTNIASIIAAPSSTGPTHAASDSSITQFYMPLPPTLAAPINTMVSDTFSALQAANGQLTNIPFNSAAQIYADAAAIRTIAVPLTQSDDPTVASSALDVLGYVGSIVFGVQSPTGQPVDTVEVTNPNLFSLAAQYYNDATLWQKIADANNINPPDPMPVGQFSLVIPSVVSA